MIAEAFTDLIGSVFSRRANADIVHHGTYFPWSDFIRQTISGEHVTEGMADKMAAVWCATRIISEGMASLPLNYIEKTGPRTRREANESPLWPLLHDAPNKEQDAFAWRDQAVKFQILRGDAFFEIERSFDTSEIIGLWPIHPSRVTVTRDAVRTMQNTHVGGNGRLTYLVKMDDLTEVAMDADDVLHLPGAISEDGLTGKSYVRIASESLGIIKATEKHVGSFFKNGASPDMAVIVKERIPKEEQENLRATWRKQYTGAENAHKALMLFGDSDIKSVGVNPEEAQLLESRKFGVAEVARFWMVPRHFLMDNEASTFNNVELLSLNFLKYTLRAWLRRWEAALNRQLISEGQRNRFTFKFNLNAFLQGDSEARSKYYESLYKMGVLSINDIREKEDMNPIEGGDVHLIQGNNMFPLDRVDELGPQRQPATLPEPDDDEADVDVNDDDQAMQVERSYLQSLLTKEIRSTINYECRVAVSKAKKPREFEEWCCRFYTEQVPEKLDKYVRPVFERAARLQEYGKFDEFKDNHVQRSKDALLACLEVPMSEFAGAVQTTVDGWDGRAVDEAASVFQTEVAGL